MRLENGVVAAWEALRRRPFATLLVASAALKLGYVFFLTQYPTHLFSDFLGYWQRARDRMAGDEFGYGQWAFWPPMSHILLAQYLSAVRAVGLAARELQATLVLNVAASTACVALLYGIALETLKARAWALGVAALYAFTFPLVYFNAFVMSEHGATLLMLAALWLVLRFGANGWVLLAAGGLLALATAMRPVLGVFGLPAALYLAFAGGRLSPGSVIRAAAFSCGFFLVLAGAVAETQRISQGRVHGLSANGPLGLYIAQCRTSVVHLNYAGNNYVFVSPSFVDRPENGEVYLNLTDYDGGILTALAWRCLREEREPGRALLTRAADLFFGPLLPSVRSPGFAELLPLFRWLFFACALLLPLGFAVRSAHGVSIPALSMIGGLLGMATIVFAVYGTEHRYLYPLVPLLYVVDAAVLLGAQREPPRFLKAAGALAAGIAACIVVALGVEAMRWSGPPPIQTELHEQVPATTNLPSVPPSRRLYSPAGERLIPSSDGEFLRAVHSTCMEVRVAGVYEFQVRPAAGFTLTLDDRQLLSQPGAQQGQIYRWRVQLAPGKHRYVLRMDRPVAATATWRRIASQFDEVAPALGMHYVGEPGEEAAFLPPGQC